MESFTYFDLLKKYAECCKQNKKILTEREFSKLLPSDVSITAWLKKTKNKYSSFTEESMKTHPEFFVDLNTKDKENLELITKIETLFIKLVNKKKSVPTTIDFYKSGIKEAEFRKVFGNFTALVQHMINKYPEECKDIKTIGEDVPKVFNNKRYNDLMGNIKKYKKFVITTVVSGCPVNRPFYNSLNTFCKKNDACLLIMVSDKKYSQLNPDLLKENIVFTEDDFSDLSVVDHEISLNSNIHLSTIPIPAKQIRTLTGLNNLCQKKGPTILAAPKQFLKYVAVSKQKPPHCLMSTGALTDPVYNGARYIQKRTDYLAHIDHTIGAIVVEIESEKVFHFRQITAEKDGSFYDLDKQYSGNKVIKNTPEAFVMGDLHSIRKDEEVFNVWIDIIKTLKPNQIVLHDVFDGVAISHHTEGRDLTRAILYKDGYMNLEKEIDVLNSDLTILSKLAKKLVITKGNHDEHLYRYLDEGRYMRDFVNRCYAHKLIGAVLEKRDPLKEACELRGLTAKNITWLRRDEDYYVADCQLGNHGDLGANGAKGSETSYENAYGNCVLAHTHSPSIHRSVYRVGTTSKMEMGYNFGLSSWLATSCIVHKSGARQLINSIFGKWRA